MIYKTEKERAEAYQKQLNRQNAYAKANFDHVSFVLPKGYKDAIKQRYTELGMTSMTDYFKHLLENDNVRVTERSDRQDGIL